MNILTSEGKEILKAHAEMTGTDIKGSADFVEYEFGEQKVVKISVEIEGLKAGKHAVHIHEKGDCNCEGFKCAGGHFDPGPAGNTDPDVNHPYHAGDLPSITVDEAGKGTLEAISTRITLSDGPLCILSGQGTALMIHANPDPYQGGEHGSGVSGGPRLACGVIKAA